MLLLSNISKSYKTRFGRILVLNRVSFSVKKGQKVGILGRNGSGKSTLVRILSGAEQPTSGCVSRGMSVSWPLAFTGGFQGSLTGADNVRFICRIYKKDFNAVMPYVESFSELGRYLREPLKTYSSGMQARLAFAVSMAIEFDCFLIDEVMAVGDSRFVEKCNDELFRKRKDRSIVLVSHIPAVVRMVCDSAVVLERGKLHEFECIESAVAFYNEAKADGGPCVAELSHRQQ